MPQSSVYLRLQWPSSSSSESSHDISPLPSSGSSIEASPMFDRDIERNTPLDSHSSVIMDNSNDKKTMQSAVPLSRSHSFTLIDLKCNTDSVKEVSGKKVKLRKKNEEMKSRRMVRSLSGTSTASTSTDPEDFFYACTVSRYPSTFTLPPHLKEISPRIIIPSKDESTRTELDVESSENIPDVDTKDNGDNDQESKNSPPDTSEGFLHSYASIFNKLKERTSKTFTFPKRRLKFTHNRDNTPEFRGNDSSLHFLEEVAEESIPDIVNDCKVNLSAGFQDDEESLPAEENFEMQDYDVDSSKSQKKSVTFLLPPLYCDSFIAEEMESPCGEYPPSGYAELDGTLMPPNGRDPYRNSPSPALHGVPSERYVDGVYEEDPFLGDYPDDGFQGRIPDVGSYPSREGAESSYRNPEEYRGLDPEGADGGYASTRDLEQYPVVRWRDPDLHEVIDFLSNPNNIVKANAAAYLQHLCYMDDATKQKTRILGGIPPLVALLAHDLSELHRNACGALRNLSYGRQNDENKRAIKDAGGLPALVRLLRKTLDNEVKELVTGILWNLSSCEDLKQSILDETLGVLVSHVIIPCSGWDGGEVERDPNNDVWWSTVFKNASGIIRNISSAGEYARTKLRHCPGLVDSLFCVIKLAIQGNSHDNKSVENCVCILRNLSYRCQEVEDPNYDKHQPPTQSRATAASKGDNLGCFGGSRKKKEMVGGQLKELESGQRSTGPRGQPVRGMELLWQPELVVQPYLALLSDCSNPETLEAAAGAIQNLAACYWQPSIDVRAAVRKEKGLPILVELLRMEVDRVVCAVATALRNLAIDQRNKELIGKYAMRDLVQKLPSQNSHDATTSDETIAAVLATLNEVIKRNAEFSRSLLEAGGVDRLVYITRQRGRYSTRVVKFASQVLFSMWGHQELREVYKKSGWKEQDFVSKSVAARNAAGGANSPTANNTLNRPMASQGGTRYEDRTIQRSNNQNKHQYQRREEVPLADLGYGGDGGMAPGGVRTYGHLQGKPGEPVYAKVNREKKRNRQYDSGGLYISTGDDWGEAPPAYSAIHPVPPASSSNYSEPNIMMNPLLADAANNNEIFSNMGSMEQTGRTSEPAGDSWV